MEYTEVNLNTIKKDKGLNLSPAYWIKKKEETLNKISMGNYGDYSSNNYGTSRYVTIGQLTLYFSYETIIAFKEGSNFTIIKNYWRKVTGRHLNCLDRDKSIRLSQEEFKEKLWKTLQKYNLVE